jgi:hypothetical protein
MSRPPFYIRVTMEDGKLVKREMMTENGEKLRDVSFVEIVEMVMQFTSSLRYEKVK